MKYSRGTVTVQQRVCLKRLIDCFHQTAPEQVQEKKIYNQQLNVSGGDDVRYQLLTFTQVIQHNKHTHASKSSVNTPTHPITPPPLLLLITPCSPCNQLTFKPDPRSIQRQLIPGG